jgi:hypothetical protein
VFQKLVISNSALENRKQSSQFLLIGMSSALLALSASGAQIHSKEISEKEITQKMRSRLRLTPGNPTTARI